jgi:hypothetical protein
LVAGWREFLMLLLRGFRLVEEGARAEFKVSFI